ncbi:recombinase family protein [Enterococcus rivorum]|uniref:Recombinase n=1 Tax=Enterococcus rivorum TaxID=762845 RepID=A0A1E5KWS7_9ENTE|nr:recombinase family protein [Enterococcus rivorum]MBP2097341.1 DNA invertase Pin-like site-specific DNA recombinase [Enterococcus rivorum]OEH82313.1 recombinase [Enterococcus rivorum]
MIFGYARVSTKEQNLDRQIQKFNDLGIESRCIFVDKQSGAEFNRPQYQLLLHMLRSGDLIYLDSLDRLGRNYSGVIEEWKYITRKIKADIIVLENSELFDSRKFKTMGDIGLLLEDQFLSMLSYVADQERKKNKQRQIEGIEVAKTAGTVFGRPKLPITEEFRTEYFRWKEGKQTATETINHLKLSPSTFYRRVKELELKDGNANENNE